MTFPSVRTYSFPTSFGLSATPHQELGLLGNHQAEFTDCFAQDPPVSGHELEPRHNGRFWSAPRIAPSLYINEDGDMDLTRMPIQGAEIRAFNRAVAPSSESPTNSRIDKKRLSEIFYQRMTFQYGELPKDHPLQIDLERCLHMARKDPITMPVRIVVLPLWTVPNALVVPDGTIFISTKLIGLCEYWEEIIALFGHELQHLESGDLERAMCEPSSGKSETEMMEDILKKMSVQRMQEARSDLEGAAHKLNEAGVNPDGLKMLFLRLHEIEVSRKSHDILNAHGSCLDRALLLGGMAQLVHLSHLAHTLTRISDEQRRAWQQGYANQGHLKYFQSYRLLYRDERQRARAHQRRLEELKQLSTKNRNLALFSLYRHFNECGVQMPPDVAEVAQQLMRLIDADLQTHCGGQRELSLMLLVHYYGNLGIRVQAPPFERVFKQFCNVMRSPQDCVSLLAVIDKLRQADLGIQWGAAESILQVVANACLNNAVFGKFEAGQFDLDTFYLTMSQIAQQLVLLYHERGCFQYTEDNLMHRLNEFLREYSHTTGERALQQTISELIESKTPPQSEGEKLSALVLLFWEQPELVCLIEEYRLLLATRLTPQGPNVLAPWPRFMDFCQRLNRFFNGFCAEKSLTESSRLLSDLFTGFWYEIDASLLANLSANFSFRKTERQYQVQGSYTFCEKLDLLDIPWVKKRRSDIAQKVQVLFYSMVIECIMEKPEVKGLSTFQQAALLRELLLYYDCYRDQQQSTFLGAGVAANRESAVLPIYTASAKQLIQWGRATNIADLVWFYELIQTASVRHSGQRVQAENFCTLQSVVKDQTDILTEIIVRRLADLDAPEHLTSLQEWTRAGLPVRDLLARWRFKRADYSEPEPNSEYRERAVHRRKETAELVLNLMKALPTYKRLGQQGELLEIVTLLEANISLREAMQRQTLEHLWKKAGTFEARLALAFEHPFSRREMTLKRRLIEEEMGSEVEVQAVAGRIRQNFDDLYGEGDEVLAVEQIRYFFGKRYSFETLNILLHTHSSDHNLKNTISSILDEDGFLVGAPKGEEVVVRLRHELHSIDAMLDQLYSLPLPIRLYVIKKFLIDGKLIVEPKERQRLYKLFLDETIVASEQNSAFATVMRNVAQAMAATTIWEPIFHAITPTLAEHIARPPQAQTPWTSFGFPHMAQRAELIDSTELMKAMAESPSHATNPSARRIKGGFGTEAGVIVRKWLKAQDVAMGSQGSRQTAMQVLIEVAQRGGAMPVRFMQLMPQFIDMNPEQEELFGALYDDMRGQSKLAAIALMEKSWPDMWRHVKRVGKRLGGGSLMTVYALEMHDGSAKVVRVINPNIGYHLQITRALFDQTIDQMKLQGHINGTMHEILKIQVQLVDEWTKAELDFSAFEETETKLRTLHGRDYGGYSLLIPDSRQTEYAIPANSVFQIEDRVEGHNLTAWDELAGENDMRGVVSCIVRGFVDQLALGQVHGDAHPGNYRVTPDHRVAILDRTMSLTFTAAESALFLQAIKGPIDAGFVMKAASYFLSLVEPSRRTQVQAFVLGELAQMAKALKEGEFHQVNGSLVKLRALGVKVPLKLSLLLRNLHFYHKITVRAGFASLQEAFERCQSPQSFATGQAPQSSATGQATIGHKSATHISHA